MVNIFSDKDFKLKDKQFFWIKPKVRLPDCGISVDGLFRNPEKIPTRFKN